jgi:2-polyprenyl-3-methyl-5-hydroxy-6-metoxy-1,4-benzoquinol methylase
MPLFFGNSPVTRRVRMERVIESELMNEETQVKAYADADFEEPNSNFLALFQEVFVNHRPQGYLLDLGCGPGDITLRFAGTYPECIVHGVDGSAPMLRFAKEALARKGLSQNRVAFIQGILPNVNLPRTKYHVIISNGLLHHLHNPGILWRILKSYSLPGTLVLVRDLIRPQSSEEAWKIVETYSRDDPKILQTDFYNSLRAAFRVEEVEGQLREWGLEYLLAKKVSDRHLAVMGIIE